MDLSNVFSLLQQHLPSLEVEGDMEGIPHFYLIYIIHYVVVVTQASLQSDNNVFSHVLANKVFEPHTGLAFEKQCNL
jgi:hypothetical protein